MEHTTVLPDSRQTVISTPKGAVWNGSGFDVPIFCPSCGVEGGRVPEENMTFAFWLCKPCFERYGELTNFMVMPDEVFWKEVEYAQMEHYGHMLNAEEQERELGDPESVLSLLARSRKAMTPNAGA